MGIFVLVQGDSALQSHSGIEATGGNTCSKCGFWEFLAIQWSGLHTSTGGDIDSIPGRGNKNQRAVWHGQTIKINCFTKMWLTSEIHLSPTEDWEIEIIEGEQKL